MILDAKQQKKIQVTHFRNQSQNALLVKEQGKKHELYKKKKEEKKARDAQKQDWLCEIYNINGHDKITCFKLHGYPDWWKCLKEQNPMNQMTSKEEFILITSKNGV